MESVRDIVQKIVNAARKRADGFVILDREWEALEHDMEDALAAERAKLEKFAAFADENGEPRKVLGRGDLTEAMNRIMRKRHDRLQEADRKRFQGWNVAAEQENVAAELQRLREGEDEAATNMKARALWEDDGTIVVHEDWEAFHIARAARIAFEKKIGGGT
jgi:hypothetical protein